MTVRRAAVLIAALLVALVLPTASASAADKKPHPGTPYTYLFAAGEACAFPVQWSGIDDSTVDLRPDGSAYTHGYYDATITNLDTGKSVFRVASGPGLFLPGGRVLRAHGTWVVQSPASAGHKARLILISGSFKIALPKGTVYGAKPGTTVQNLCSLVS